MPLLLFVQIGIIAGSYGLAKIIPAALDQKKARKINERANELLKNVLPEDKIQETVFELEPMAPVLKKGALLGAKLGFSAALGTCGMAELLAITGRNVISSFFGITAGKFTILEILGDGSLAVEAVVLVWIAAGVSGAVLGSHVSERAKENIERSYSNLFQAKRIRRENRLCEIRKGENMPYD